MVVPGRAATAAPLAAAAPLVAAAAAAAAAGMAVRSAVPELRSGTLPGRGTQVTNRYRGQTPECSG